MKPAVAQKLFIEGPAGRLEVAVTGEARRGIALIAHPHPSYGGTLDNKVVQTLAKAFVALGYCSLRLNFRGAGASEGVFDDGRGEVEDFLALADYGKRTYGGAAGELAIGGFSFGGFIAAAVPPRLTPRHLVLVAPAVGRFPVQNVPENTLVIHGEEDDVVPLQSLFDWARPQVLPVTVFPGAGHFFHGNLGVLQRVVERHCATP